GRLTVDPELGRSNARVELEAQRARETFERRGVLGRDPLAMGTQGERPVHQPRVHVREAELGRQPMRERALPGPGGPVDRDHRPHAETSILAPSATNSCSNPGKDTSAASIPRTETGPRAPS